MILFISVRSVVMVSHFWFQSFECSLSLFLGQSSYRFFYRVHHLKRKEKALGFGDFLYCFLVSTSFISTLLSIMSFRLSDPVWVAAQRTGTLELCCVKLHIAFPKAKGTQSTLQVHSMLNVLKWLRCFHSLAHKRQRWAWH